MTLEGLGPEFRGCNSQSYSHWLDSFMLTPP